MYLNPTTKRSIGKPEANDGNSLRQGFGHLRAAFLQNWLRLRPRRRRPRMRRLPGKVSSFSSISTSSACSLPLLPGKSNIPDKLCLQTVTLLKTCSCEVLKDPSSKEKGGDEDGNYGVGVPDKLSLILCCVYFLIWRRFGE